MAKRLIVFVHGLGADESQWWGSTPIAVSTDPGLRDATVRFWGYETSHGAIGFLRRIRNSLGMGARRQTLQQLGQHLRSDLRTLWQQEEYDRLSLVGHSMGGLVLAAALGEDRRDEIDEALLDALRELVLIASPLGGADLAELADRVLRPAGGNVHVSDLRRDSPTRRAVVSRFINRVLSAYSQLKVRLVILRASDDAVVDEPQLTAPLPEFEGKKDWYAYEVLSGTHSGCVQNLETGSPNLTKILAALGPSQREAPPDSSPVATLLEVDRPDLSDPLAETAPLEAYETPSIQRFDFRGGSARLSSRYPIIGFDVDGTLLRGLEFSWTRVWDYLGFTPDVRNRGMKRYLRGEITYSEWCGWACQHFRSKKLSRDQFAEITQEVTLTRNLREALSFLRNDGRLLAVVSGGIDAFLLECIPDAAKLFDYIFINRMQFDDLGYVAGVEATPFDFGGKATALRRLAASHGLELKNVAFVGEGFNDGAVARSVGLSIAYPPTATGVAHATDYQIETDDLNEILKYL